MKTCLAFLLTAAAITVAAEDIKTIDGKEYKNVTISRVEPDGVVIMASYGIIKIPFEQLPPELREKYHYDQKAAAHFQTQREAADAERNRVEELARQRHAQQNAAAPAPSEVPRVSHQVTNVSEAAKPERFSTSSTGRREPWAIKGKVLSAADGGVIVYCIDDGTVGRAKPEDRSVVFIKGLNLMDGDRVDVEAIPDGTSYHYTAASGAAKIVRSFQLR